MRSINLSDVDVNKIQLTEAKEKKHEFWDEYLGEHVTVYLTFRNVLLATRPDCDCFSLLNVRVMPARLKEPDLQLVNCPRNNPR